MAVNFKDASDRKGRTVNENLYNIVQNMDKIAGRNDVNVSIHFNAFNRSATGAEVWYYLGDNVGYQIAKKLSATIAKTLGITDRGAKATTNLYVISRSVGHTVLIEVAFIDNASDMKKYMAKKSDVLKAMMGVFASFPQYNFKTSHGGHGGLNMMDPGAIGNGYKEAVLVQEINKYFLGNKTVQPPKTSVKPTTPSTPTRKPLTDGKVGDTVKVVDALYADSTGSGRSTASRGKQGKIKRIVGNSKKYLIENWGWAHANDIQLVKRASTSKPAKQASKTPAKPQAKEYAESGTFTITSGPIALRLGNTPNSKLVSWLGNGQSVKYDRVKLDVDGHVWVRQTPKRREGYAWIATGKTNANAQRGNNPRWGTFK